jgi:hypothetical protein
MELLELSDKVFWPLLDLEFLESLGDDMDKMVFFPNTRF